MANRSILVVEDEPLIADDIAQSLSLRGYEVFGPVDTAEDAIASLQRSMVDLVLLDIQLKGKKDGIYLAHQLRSQFQLPFIFLTSFYDRPTLERAKVTEPQAYIVKPFDEQDLFINVEMALYRHSHRPALLSDKLFVKDKNEMVALDSASILYAEAFDNYTKVFTAQQQYIISHTLKQIEEKLLPKGFVRVHRSYLVNFEHITSISESSVCLGLVKLPLGPSHRQDLLNRINLL